MSLIREAEPADAGGIAAIWNPIIRETVITFTTAEKTKTELQALIEDHHARNLPFLVSELDSTVQGFASASQFRNGPGYLHTLELTIHLAPQARGQGIATKLLEALEVKARTEDVHILIAGISGTNERALRFHKKHGFRQVGYMPEVGWKFDTPQDLLLLQKFL